MFSIKSCHLSQNQELLDHFLDVYFGSKGDVARKQIRLAALPADLRSAGLGRISKDKLLYIRHIFKTRGATQLQFQELLAIFRESHERSNKGVKLNRIKLRNAPVKPLSKSKRDRSPVREFQAKLYEKTNQRLQVHPPESVSRGEVEQVMDEIEKAARALGLQDMNEALWQVFYSMDSAKLGAISKEDFFHGLQQFGINVAGNVSDAVFVALAKSRTAHTRLTQSRFVESFAERIKPREWLRDKKVRQTCNKTASEFAEAGVDIARGLLAIVRQLGAKDSLLDVFRYFDQNLDGKVCVDDMKSGVIKLAEQASVDVTQHHLDRIYALVGLNDHAFLSYNQFRTGFEKLCEFSVNPKEPSHAPSTTTIKADAGEQEDESYDVLLRIALHLRQSMNTRIARFHDVFNFLDSENLGKLSKKALGKGLHLMNIPISRRELDQLFKVLDVKSSGFVSYSNLEASLQVAEKQRHQLKVACIEPLSRDLTRGQPETFHEAKCPKTKPPIRVDANAAPELQPEADESLGALRQQECHQYVGEAAETNLLERDPQRIEFLVNASVYLIDPSIFAPSPRSVFSKLFNNAYKGVHTKNIRKVYVDTSQSFFEKVLDAMKSETQRIKSNDLKQICWAKAMGLEVDETSIPSKNRKIGKTTQNNNLVEKRVSFSVGTNGKPTEIQLREYETLILERVHGSGKVLLNAYDVQGRAVVLSATVFDSCAYFHCVSPSKSNGNSKIHVLSEHGSSRQSRAFPGGYRYEFFVVPTCTLPTTYHKGSFQTTSQAKVPVNLQLDFIIQINVEQ